MRILGLAGILLLLSSCSNLKPVQDRTRFFLLVAQPVQPAARQLKGLGLARPESPEYLKPLGIAVRKGAEIEYSARFQWAESLQSGIPRVLAAQLGQTNLFPVFWRRGQVSAELYVSIKEFDLDEQGMANLSGSWRLAAPGGGAALAAGAFSIRKHGPPLREDPAAAVLTLGAALAEMSENIRSAIDKAPIDSAP